MMVTQNTRLMSSASIKSRFEEAFQEKQKGNRASAVPQPTDNSYAKAYYEDKLKTMGKGFVHPYHTQ